MKPQPGDTRWHHLAGPVGVLAVEGPAVRVVASERGAIFWTWASCLWRTA